MKLKKMTIGKRIAISFGIIVTLLGFVSAFLGLFGIHDISLLLELPTLFFEIAIGVWLIVKGFDQEVLSSLNQKT